MLGTLKSLIAGKRSVALPDGERRPQAKAEYESGWQSIERMARGFAGEGGNLARVLSMLDRAAPPDANQELLQQFGFRVFGRRMKAPLDNRYEGALFRLILQNEILHKIEPDTANIIELGSGYGRNLFRIWLNGGPAKASYLGFEYTEAGRRCSDFLASLEPNIPYRAVPFDYHNPSIEGFDRQAKTFVLTSYSIEQIPLIRQDVFDRILAIPGFYRAVHIEPVGWQRTLPKDLDREERTLLRDMEQSARALHYNTNLLQILEKMERAGRIVIDERKYDFLAHRPNLPGSVIAWRPPGDRSA